MNIDKLIHYPLPRPSLPQLFFLLSARYKETALLTVKGQCVREAMHPTTRPSITSSCIFLSRTYAMLRTAYVRISRFEEPIETWYYYRTLVAKAKKWHGTHKGQMQNTYPLYPTQHTTHNIQRGRENTCTHIHTQKEGEIRQAHTHTHTHTHTHRVSPFLS